jgi:hypothetical protein
MPCYTVRTIQQDLTVGDKDVLVRGLKAAGFTVSENANGIMATKGYEAAVIAGGRIETTEAGKHLINEVKRAYSNEAVRTAAKRYGWLLQPQATTGRYVAHRR